MSLVGESGPRDHRMRRWIMDYDSGWIWEIGSGMNRTDRLAGKLKVFQVQAGHVLTVGSGPGPTRSGDACGLQVTLGPWHNFKKYNLK